MPRIVLASRNRKKSAEMAALLAPHGIEVVSMAEFPDAPEVIEDGTTFAANAAKKATEMALHLGEWVIGEDSGLMVDALDGAPGIYSARYAGEPSDDTRNNAKLLTELTDVPDEQRTARYVCNAAVVDSNGQVRFQVEATCQGRITREPLGTYGFGYDPYFLIPEYHRTFGQLGATVKQHLSHRARAFERLIPALRDLLASE